MSRVNSDRDLLQEALNYKTKRQSESLTPVDICLWVIVNEKPLNLEKTTSSVISVLLINLCLDLWFFFSAL